MAHQIKGPIIQKPKRSADAHGPSMKEGHQRALRKPRLNQLPNGTSLKEALLAMPNVGEDRDFERGPQLERPLEL